MARFYLIGLITIIFLSSCNNNSSEKKAEIQVDSTLKAVADMKKIVNQFPDSVPLKVQFIDALDSMKQYKEAIAQIDCLIIKDRFNNNLWLRKGQILREKGDTLQAIDALNHSAAIYPSPDILLELANLFAEKKNPKALEICENIKKMSLGQTTDSYASFFEGVYYARIHQRDKAQQFFDLAISDNYTFPDAYLEKGYLYFDNKQYKEALVIFQKLSDINNANANAYYWQAKCFEAMNNKEDALTSYQKAYGLDKSIIEAKAAMDRLSR